MRPAVLVPLIALAACSGSDDAAPGSLDAAPGADAAGSDAGEPATPALDLAMKYEVGERAMLVAYFEGPTPAPTNCHPMEFVLPGQARSQHAGGMCPRTTCVTELRLVRGAEVLKSVAVTSDNWIQFENADAPDLELEVHGCGEPARVPLGFARPTPPTQLSSSAPGSQLAIDIGDPSATTSYSSFVWNNDDVAQYRHTLPGATRLETGLGRCPITIDMRAVNKNGEARANGVTVRRWSTLRLLDTTVCVPSQVGDRWVLELDGGSASAWMTTVASNGGAPTELRITPTEVTIDRLDPTGLVELAGTVESVSPWLTFKLSQGAVDDTLRVVTDDGKVYLAVTPHAAPTRPVNFGVTGDRNLTFAISAPLHFVNVANATDSFDLASLSLRWLVSYQVALPQP